MKNHCLVWFISGVFVVAVAHADSLTIPQVQSNTSDGDASVYDGQIHDVSGGIVTHKWYGGTARVYLQDPAQSSWGGIIVKDWEGGELANAVNVGDRVDFTDIMIEESRGTTHLQYNKSWAPSVAFTVVSTGNPVPDPIALTAADLPVPVNHAVSESYESMLVTLQDLVVGQRDLGKAGDNYELNQGADTSWGTDYQNLDAGGPYDPRIVTGRVVLSITGVVEQYLRDDPPWDYYQVDTRASSDIVVGEIIPAVTSWGVAVMALLVVSAGTIVLRRTRRAAT